MRYGHERFPLHDSLNECTLYSLFSTWSLTENRLIISLYVPSDRMIISVHSDSECTFCHHVLSHDALRVEHLLPVQIGDEWVGVVFHNGKPAKALMDRYDIVNKALSCDPSFNIHSMDWFDNHHLKLHIVRNEATKSTPLEFNTVIDLNETTDSTPCFSDQNSGSSMSAMASSRSSSIERAPKSAAGSSVSSFSRGRDSGIPALPAPPQSSVCSATAMTSVSSAHSVVTTPQSVCSVVGSPAASMPMFWVPIPIAVGSPIDVSGQFISKNSVQEQLAVTNEVLARHSQYALYCKRFLHR